MRHKDGDWKLPDGIKETLTWEQAGIAVLMDIRDELKRLNHLLICPAFIDMPQKLERIARNTAKRRNRRSKMEAGAQ